MRSVTLLAVALIACSKAPADPAAPASAADPAAAPASPHTPTSTPAPPSTPTPAATFVAGEDYQVLERVMFLDDNGFDRPVEAFSLLFPSGWRTEGGIRWGRIDQCRGELVQLWLKASSPDGTMRLEAQPPRSFGWSDDPNMRQLMEVGARNGGCRMNRPFDAGEFITGMAQSELGATASDIRADEQLMVQARQSDEQANAISRQYGNGLTQTTTIVWAKLTWPSGDEGLAQAGVTNSITQKPDLLTGAMTSWSSTYVFHSVVMRFPASRRDEARKLLAMIQASHRTNPVWAQAKEQFLTQLGNAEHAARMEKIRLVGEQSKAYARERSAAMDREMRDWERGQDAQDRQVRGFIQTIREVETWNGAGGGVELSAGYEKAWSRGDGRYILSNKPGFDPSSVFQDQAWQEMTRAR